MAASAPTLALKSKSVGKDPGAVGLSRAWRVNRRHQGIYSGGKVQLASSEDVVACMFGENVVFADVTNGQVLSRLSCGEGEGKEVILTFTLHPSAREVVTASRNLMVRHWDWDKALCIRSFRAHDTPVSVMEYDMTGTLVATGSSDGIVKVWDIPGGFCTHNFRGHTKVLTAVLFHPDTKKAALVSAAEDCTVRVWSLKGQACLAVLTKHMATPTCLAFSGDGRTLLTGGRDQVVNFWSAEGERFDHIETVPVFDELEGLQTLDGLWPSFDKLAKKSAKKGHHWGFYAAVGSKGCCKVYHYGPRASGTEFLPGLANQLVAQQHDHETCNKGYTGLLVAPRARQLVCVTADHDLYWLTAPVMDRMERERVLVGYNDEIIEAKYLVPAPWPHDAESGAEGEGSGKRGAPKEERLVVASNSAEVRVFRLSDLSCEMMLEGQHVETVLSLDVSPDGHWVATASKDRVVCLWDAQGGACVARYEGHTASVGAVVLSRRLSAYAGTVNEKQALLLSAASDKTIKRWAFPGRSSPSSGGTCQVVKDSVVTVMAHDKDINALALSPNDAFLASASQDKTIKLWDSRTLKPLGVLSGHKRGVWSLDFSPLDRCLVSGGADRVIKVWSLTDQRCLRTLEGHGTSVLRVAFLRSGLQLLSTGSDGLVKLWTIRTGECDATFDEHTDRAWALAVHPGGKKAVTGGSDSTLNFWEDVTVEEEEKALAEAEARVEKEQDLENSIRRRDYRQAIHLALELGQPLRLWRIFQELMEQCQAGAKNPHPLDAYVKEWSDQEIKSSLGYLREWNTNAKHAPVAQALLNSLLRVITPDNLIGYAKEDLTLVGGLMPYTERHFSRANRLVQASYLVDLTLSSMHLLFPQGEDEAAAETGRKRADGHGRAPGEGLWRRQAGEGGDDDSSDTSSEASMPGEEEGEGPLPPSEVADSQLEETLEETKPVPSKAKVEERNGRTKAKRKRSVDKQLESGSGGTSDQPPEVPSAPPLRKKKPRKVKTAKKGS